MGDELREESTEGLGMLPDLEEGLLAVPGCLGVESAATGGGKQLLFAWFEDKAAVLRWYHGEMHRGIQDRAFPGRPPHEPLRHVPEDSGPIMVVASLTRAEAPRMPHSTLPISQIAIELYQPLPAGLYIGERFAPDSLLVEGMIGYPANPDE